MGGLFDGTDFSFDVVEEPAENSKKKKQGSADEDIKRVAINNYIFIAKTEKEKPLLLRLKNLTEALTHDIKDVYMTRIIANGSFGGIEIIQYMYATLNIKKIYITTYSYNQHFLEVIERMLREGIEVSIKCDMIYRKRKRLESLKMDELLDKYPNLSYTLHYGVHAKIMVIETRQKESYVVEGSANCSNNKRIEQFIVTKDTELAEFHKEWINTLDIIK